MTELNLCEVIERRLKCGIWLKSYCLLCATGRVRCVRWIGRLVARSATFAAGMGLFRRIIGGNSDDTALAL